MAQFLIVATSPNCNGMLWATLKVNVTHKRGGGGEGGGGGGRGGVPHAKSGSP